MPAPVTPWDFIEVQRKELLTADELALERLAASYRTHAEAIRRLLLQVTAQIERALANGETPHPNWLWRQQRWEALLVQATNEMRLFGDNAAQIVAQNQKAAGVMGLDHSVKRLQVVGPGVSFQQLPREAVDMIVAQLQTRAPAGALLRDIASSVRDGIAEEMRQAMVDEITTGIAIGRNPRDVAKRIYNQVGTQVDELGYRRAEVICRTESMRTYRAAQTANYRANADVVEGWVWVAALNVFTCPACLAKHLSFHPLSEEMSSHLACRCTAMPMVSDDVPNLPTGDEWLREQDRVDPDRVRKIMGSQERYDLWKKGKISTSDLGKTVPNVVWGPSEQVTPLRDLRRIANGELPSRPNVTWDPNAPLNSDANPKNGPDILPTIKD